MNDERWYLDSSALIKRVISEPESAALTAWMADVTNLAACDLVRVETVRAIRRHDETALSQLNEMIDSLDLIALDLEIYRAAAALDQPRVRSLDAIHLAAALSIASDLAGIVTYDQRMSEAAVLLGLRVEAPK